MNFDETISQVLLYGAMASGAVIAAFWLGIILWTLRDMRARSRDVLAQGAAALMVAVLNIFGLILYMMLRPRETLAEAYERSLEEEALLQGIEEKPICPGCGRPSDARWQVCPYCHTRLKKNCIRCKELIDLSWNLCPYCATPQSNTATTPSANPTQESAVKTAVRGRRGITKPMGDSSSLEFVDEDDV